MMPEHFVRPPDWGWWILLYFFFGGLTGGSYALGTLLRLSGRPANDGVARTAFVVSFLTLILCPIFLTIDLGRPDRFSHMLFGDNGINFRAGSPMSVGAWALLIFGIFSFVSFLEAMEQGGRLKSRVFSGLLGGAFGTLFMIVGTVFGLYIAGYTGVLLSVSSQPVWSDTWMLGALFVASALSGAAAAIALAARRGSGAAANQGTVERLARADTGFIILELAALALFLITLGSLAAPVIAGGYGILFWVVAVALGMLLPLVLHWFGRGVSPVMVCTLVLIGNLALRAVIVFAPQG
jgi:formate-dependent nitrite reductase membrane component NrfD